MTRSLKKNPFVANHLSGKIEKLNMREEKEIIVTWSRASTIIPTMIGHTIAIHNGKENLQKKVLTNTYVLCAKHY
nr:ribosomal protein S19 [Cocos nucifera]